MDAVSSPWEFFLSENFLISNNSKFKGGRGGGERAAGGVSKLIVNNLDFGVTDADMEVFL